MARDSHASFSHDNKQNGDYLGNISFERLDFGSQLELVLLN